MTNSQDWESQAANEFRKLAGASESVRPAEVILEPQSTLDLSYITVSLVISIEFKSLRDVDALLVIL